MDEGAQRLPTILAYIIYLHIHIIYCMHESQIELKYINFTCKNL